ncbi:MAG: Acetyltransferase family protein [Tardiphaga sp.]|nr:Acetyltransferase family protein [Tardiphaga sp.]
MGGTDHSAILGLHIDDARACLALSEEAHWNQTEADWRFFLTEGTVFGIRDGEGLLIATAALLPYGGGNAWISMVLVTADWQRRGIATKLIDTSLDTAARLKLTTWLDATPAGAAVYGPLGFTPSGESQRLRFDGTATPASAPQLLSIGNIEDLIARDRRAMDFDRSALLHELAGRSGSRIVARDGAMALIRDGRKARHIGPLFADHTASAATLIQAIVQSESGPFLLDVVGDQRRLVDSLTPSGWTVERPFRRMRFGRIRTTGTEPPFAGAGPEYG